MYILGISAFYHDSSASLIKEGEIIAAAQEERFTRVKHDHTFPSNAIKYCLDEEKLNFSKIDFIVFYDKPFLKFERLFETYLSFAPFGFKSFVKSMPVWIKDKLFQKSVIKKELKKIFGKNNDFDKKLLFSEHHLSHAASAFYPSPFEEAAILTMDGVGEWTTTSIAIGRQNTIKVLKEINFPHSLGLLYSAFTSYIGFKVNSGEYKLMGLAPYGSPIYKDLIKDNLIEIKDDGSFKLNMSYFDYCKGLKMTNRKFHNLFNGIPKKNESKITQREMDIASSIQKVIEEVILKICKNIAKETGQKNLCLAGGVALNCVANGILLKEKIFENIWIQPAAGDAGGAIGAALSIYHIFLNKSRIKHLGCDGMKGSYLGPKFANEDIKKTYNKIGAKFNEFENTILIEKIAKALDEGKAIGLMNGRMEFGPRALGGRSIIADPRSENMQKILNLKVKYRESFRPFAPSILFEELNNWFNLKVPSPYMLFVSDVTDSKKLPNSDEEKLLFGLDKLNLLRSTIPAVTHVDYSSRIQTVHKETNPFFYKILSKFNELTGCPIVVNTSFNVRGEPIVCSPEDAFRCFMGTELDMLVVENILLLKEDQSNDFKENYKLNFRPD